MLRLANLSLHILDVLPVTPVHWAVQKCSTTRCRKPSLPSVSDAAAAARRRRRRASRKATPGHCLCAAQATHPGCAPSAPAVPLHASQHAAALDARAGGRRLGQAKVDRRREQSRTRIEESVVRRRQGQPAQLLLAAQNTGQGSHRRPDPALHVEQRLDSAPSLKKKSGRRSAPAAHLSPKAAAASAYSRESEVPNTPESSVHSATGCPAPAARAA